ncbi:hypothetical protein BJV40_002247 [Clostridium beijerinckii]|nr:hypothetical protein [Clostridium beijerinckii]
MLDLKCIKKYINMQVHMVLLKKGLENLKPGDSGSDVLEVQKNEGKRLLS